MAFLTSHVVYLLSLLIGQVEILLYLVVWILLVQNLRASLKIRSNSRQTGRRVPERLGG